MVTYRVATSDDRKRAEAIDNSFTTDTILEVTAADGEFRVRPVPVDPPVRKVYPDDEDETEGGEHVIVALDAEGEVCGAITLAYATWNRCLRIADLRVSPSHRGQGIGAALMEQALTHGRELTARTAWLEVTNVNAPAVRAYRRLGFAVCGLDKSLYVGTESEGEVALFMSRGV
ncbi:GNAT family N-acetyltransferase [Streptomyces sp. NPDC020667]|uniref:GNAT family N-acetyltransferase n=1 Tax=Streptomyces sp. NPDC020667 TaxID=3154895 RepID=UPI0033F761A3